MSEARALHRIEEAIYFLTVGIAGELFFLFAPLGDAGYILGIALLLVLTAKGYKRRVKG